MPAVNYRNSVAPRVIHAGKIYIGERQYVTIYNSDRKQPGRFRLFVVLDYY